MKVYDYVICLFCLSGKEKEVVENIRRMGRGVALFPQKVKYFRDKKEWQKQTVPLIPGYVFVYLMEAEKECRYTFPSIAEVIRVLDYGEESKSWLMGSDLAFAELIWKRKGILESIQTAKVGNRVEIIDNDLIHLRGRITKVDTRKRMVLIHADEGGIINNIWVPYHMAGEPMD